MLDVCPWDVSVHIICVRDLHGKEVCVPTVTVQFVCLKMVGVSDIFLRDLSLQDSVQDVLLGIIGYNMPTCEMSVSGMSIYRMSL